MSTTPPMLDVTDVRHAATGRLLQRLVECPVHGTCVFPPDAIAIIDAWRELHAQCRLPTPHPPRRPKRRHHHLLPAPPRRQPERPFSRPAPDPWSPA